VYSEDKLTLTIYLMS